MLIRNSPRRLRIVCDLTPNSRVNLWSLARLGSCWIFSSTISRRFLHHGRETRRSDVKVYRIDERVEWRFIPVSFKGSVSEINDNQGSREFLEPLRGLKDSKLNVAGAFVHIIEHDNQSTAFLASIVSANSGSDSPCPQQVPLTRNSAADCIVDYSLPLGA